MGDILRGLGCVMLIGIMVFGAIMGWFTSNPEVVGSWTEKVTGIKEAACEQQRLEFDSERDRIIDQPVDSGPIPEEIEEEMRLAEEQLDARCRPN